MVVATCLSALFSTTINATAWQKRSCVIISNVAGSRKSRHFAPFLGHFTPILPSHRLCERQGQPLSGTQGRKEVAAFALVTTVGLQPRPARSTPGEPGRAAGRQAFASLSYLTHRQVLRNPHIAKEGRHDPDIHSLRHCHAMFRPRTPDRGNESSLAFAKQLDEDLSWLGAEFQCPAELLPGVPQMLSRDDCDPLRWQEERVLRPQLRGRFHDVCEAVAELSKKTIPASSLGENLNRRLRGYFCRRRQWGADDLS